MKALLALLLLSFVYLSKADVSYEYQLSQLNGTQCLTLPLDTCTPCGSLFYSPSTQYGYLEIEMYRDSACTELYGYAYAYSDTCTTEYWFQDCQIFYQPTALNGYSLTLSSTTPIKADYLGEYIITSSLSQDKITASGNLRGLVIQSGSTPNFRFEQRLSETQYSTTYGVFSFGNTYTVNPFTFSVSPVTLSLPLPVTTQNVVTVEPFLGAWVKNGNEYSITMGYEGELSVATDELTFEGLVVSNPLYAATNITVYAPYESSYRGNIVFQLYSSSSPYFTGYCYYQSKSTYDSYDCELGSLSLSGIFSLSGLSFSLDEPKHAQPRNADEMAFSLF